MLLLACSIYPFLFYFMLYFVKAIISYYWSWYQHPPGPKGLPFVGILLKLIWQGGRFNKRQLAEYFGQKYARTTGIFSYMLGTRRFIFLHSYDAIKEAFCDNAMRFSGRPQIHLEEWFGRSVGGIVLTEGVLWKTSRQFALKVFHKLGIKDKRLHEQIHFEAEMLNDTLHKSTGCGVKTDDIFTRSVSNVISHFVFGERWKDDDEEFHTYAAWVRTGLHTGGLKDALKFLYPKLTSYRLFRRFLCDVDELSRNDQSLQNLVARKIAAIELACKQDQTKEATCFVEAFLNEVETGERILPREDGDIRYQGVRTCLDLFVAGTETTTTLLSWTMLYLAQNVSIQEKLHEEIDSFLYKKGKTQPGKIFISYQDRESLPYTKAIMDETQRLSSILFHGFMHSVDKTCFFREFLFERGDVIYANLYHVHHDEKIWGDDVNQFKPERFLSTNEEGESIYHPSKYLIPFGVGKRVCLGENLARMEYFIFLTHVMREFRVSLTPQTSQDIGHIMQGTEGIIHSPNQHTLYFLSR